VSTATETTNHSRYGSDLTNANGLLIGYKTTCGMLTRLARLETQKNFSVLSIEFLAVEKCDKQLGR